MGTAHNTQRPHTRHRRRLPRVTHRRRANLFLVAELRHKHTAKWSSDHISKERRAKFRLPSGLQSPRSQVQLHRSNADKFENKQL